jgi:predicted RNA polymerase sigma factor
LLAELDSQESEVHGLVALMEIQASRSRARVNANGQPILLLEQDRGLWDQARIQRGLTALESARSLGRGRGSYVLQAEIAACHARALTAAETNWSQIVVLYTELARVTPSPVIELNRAVAVGMAYGPEQALELLEPLRTEPLLRNYHLLPSVRGDFLERLSRHGEAAAEFERAATLTRNEREKTFLTERARASAESAAHRIP